MLAFLTPFLFDNEGHFAIFDSKKTAKISL